MLSPTSSSLKTQTQKIGLNAYGVSEKIARPHYRASSVNPRFNLSGEKIMVCVRKRPLSEKEQAKNDYDIIHTEEYSNKLILKESK